MKKTVGLLILLMGLCTLFGVTVFTEQTHSIPGIYKSSVAWGDYDNDGDLDLLISGSQADSVFITRIYRNDAGSFVDINAGFPGFASSSAAWADYDNDGDLDFAIMGLSGGVPTTKIYNNIGGVFTPLTTTALTQLDSGALAWGDADSDGDLDLLVSGKDATGTPKTMIHYNTLGSFSTATAIGTAVWSSSVAWADYDNDGDQDFAISGATATSEITEIWKNNNGTFAKLTTTALGLSLSSLAWADYDNDGDLDLFIAGKRTVTYYTRIYRNDAGTFTEQDLGFPGVQNASLAMGDYNNDGYVDLLLTGEYNDGSTTTNISRIYRNTAGLFYYESGYALPGVRLSSVTWADYDADHDLDICMTGQDNSGIPITKIYRNSGSAANLAPTAPTGLTMTPDPTNANYLIFSWLPGTDAVTPQAALTYMLRMGYTSGGGEIIAPMATTTGYRKIPGQGIANAMCVWRIKASAVPYGNFYWSVQAIDGSFTSSPWASQVSFNGGRVLSPNGGENWRQGQNNYIYWYSLSNVITANTNVYFSSNNGATWTLVTGSPVASDVGRIAFAVPVITSTQCLVKVVDTTNPNIYDVSDAPFSISASPAYIQVTTQSQTAAEKLQVGRQYMVGWTYSGVSNVKIELSIDEGQTWTVLAASVPASSNGYYVTIPRMISRLCYFRVTDTANAMVYDWNNTPFSIVLLELLFPLSGNHVNTPPPVTNKINVTWTVPEGNTNNIANVKIELRDVNDILITTPTNSTPFATGSFSFAIPSSCLPTSQCRIYIYDVADLSIFDDSHGTFTVAHLELTSPSSTSIIWQMGKQYPITWTHTGVQGSLTLQYTMLYSATGSSWTTIAMGLDPNLLSYAWTIPVQAGTYSSTCRVRICLDNQESFNDISDNNFSIVYLNMVSPNGGEDWYSPSSRVITWQSYGIPNVKLDVSLNGGENWIAIDPTETSVDGTNNYTWNTQFLNSWCPHDPTDHIKAVVRVASTSASAPTVWDVSNNNFSLFQRIEAIYPPNPYLQSPYTDSDHACIKQPITIIRGTSYTILWRAEAEVSNVSLHYQKGSGTVTQIAASVACVGDTLYNRVYGLPLGQLYCHYSWNVTSALATGSDYRIRVKRYPAVTPSIEDWSGVFTIADAVPAVSFSGTPLSGYQPLQVQFTDLTPPVSANTTSWLWTFGDEQTSTVQNPLHTYANPGSYSVTLWVDNALDAPRTLTKTDYIQVIANAPQIQLETATPLVFYASPGHQTGWTNVVIRNAGTTNLIVSNITFDNSSAGFVYQYPDLNQPILPNATSTIQVAFAPSVDTYVQTNMTIQNNSSNLPLLQVALKGNENPVPVTGLTVTIVDESAVLAWTAVTQSVGGNPITPDMYIIEYNETPYEGDQYYYYLWAVPNNVLTFTHYLVARYNDQYFYRVKAIKNLSPAQREYLLSLSNSKGKITWSELRSRLDNIKDN